MSEAPAGRAYVDELLAELDAGRPVPEDIAAAFRAVPRELFVPRRAWAAPDVRGAAPHAIDRDARPREWLEAVYGDVSVVTQIDDGAGDPATGTGERYTSSASAPGVVVDFLRLLGARRGDRVLEIGTGTGWTAGLLAHLVGPCGRVVTVEVDEALAELAGERLAVAGLHPRVVSGDGADGYAPDAPYDAVHVTCALARIPYALVAQCRPGGRIVTPYSPGYGYGHKIVLERLDDGTATGRFAGAAGYMMLRAHRHPTGRPSSYLHHETEADRSSTRMDPRAVVDGGPAADLMISILAPGVRRSLGTDGGGSGEATLWLMETHPTARADGSWAVVEYAPGRQDHDVEQYGPRRLWDEVAAAYGQWLGWGSPGVDRFGITVAPDGEHVWLDTSANVVTCAHGTIELHPHGRS